MTIRTSKIACRLAITCMSLFLSQLLRFQLNDRNLTRIDNVSISMSLVANTTKQRRKNAEHGQDHDRLVMHIPEGIDHYSDCRVEEVRPRNLRIAFIGDSVTRFQYLSLVYFLRHGHWWGGIHNNVDEIDSSSTGTTSFGHESGQSLFSRSGATSWMTWLNESHSYLQPNEQCDCYHNESGHLHPYHRIRENRYYRDNRGNSVTSILKYGQAKVQARYSMNEVNRGLVQESVSGIQPLYNYEYMTWPEIIRQVAQLTPKPEYVVFNAGLHRHKDLQNPSIQAEILQAFRETNMTPIFKTTTIPKVMHRRDFQPRPLDERMCQLTWQESDHRQPCLNVSWVYDISKENYLDGHHYSSVVNSALNLQLLDYLRGNCSNTTASGSNRTCSDGNVIIDPQWLDPIPQR